MAILLTPILIVFIILAYNLYQQLRFKLPPGPRPWSIVGNLYHIKPVWFQCFAEWSQAYGPIISVRFGSTLNVILSNSELAKEVLKENDQQLADRHRSRSTAKFSRDGQDLIWADYGPHYVKVRKVCSLELFTPKRLEALRPIREDEVTAMVESIFKDVANPGLVRSLSLLPLINGVDPVLLALINVERSLSVLLALINGVRSVSLLALINVV